MTEDRRDERGRRLLRMGSEAGPAAPRAGFLERLRARIAAGEQGSDGRATADPLSALGALARPALGMALAAVIFSGILFALSPSPNESAADVDAGAGGDVETAVVDETLALLEDDPSYQLLLGDPGGGWLSIMSENGNGGDER